jgi:hypothetical protein
MTYNTLERITRQAVCTTLGARSDNFDQWLETYNPDEIIEDEGFDLGTSVELYFDPAISPLTYFSSDVTFYVTVFNNQNLGAVSAFFGSSCSDVDEAKSAAGDFLDRDASDGWHVADEFEEETGLHLVREFCFEPNNEADIFAMISKCFAELCGAEVSDKLRSFIHYFED